MQEYRWSSWPEYLRAPSLRPAWLRVDRLLGEYGIAQDSAAGRRRLEAALEERRGAEEGEEFKAVRRGWCLGSTVFREDLLEQMAGGMGEHHGGQERQETAIGVAERIVGEELRRLGWSEAELANRRKGEAGKGAIARRLRRESTMTLKWIAQRLRMGSASMVTHALQRK